MNYELAKKLKEAGWNQTPTENGSNYALPIGYTFLMPSWYEKLLQKYIPAKIPTLSELIEACGKGFDFLANNRNREWQASGGQTKGGGNIKDCIGKTPEEAVANLWLALNKK